ncbi:hypothetical protein AV530_012492 [Patagioenas fasciata monilis]|uniref:Uncharacterized protein n=1 Tax=Patagioenas fasciata monilis TaxID=372326 RepID=A0A1V4JB79_PATFA|nr:hypothetical protein AV530_012492 [Patagioenas fasciata monilis]
MTSDLWLLPFSRPHRSVLRLEQKEPITEGFLPFGRRVAPGKGRAVAAVARRVARSRLLLPPGWLDKLNLHLVWKSWYFKAFR